MKNKLTFCTILILTLISTVSSTIAAKKSRPRFQIELIIFEQSDNNTLRDNSLMAELLPDFTRSIFLKSQRSYYNNYHLLPFSSYRLKNTYWALRKQNNVLLYYAWRQSEGKTRKIHLYNQLVGEEKKSPLSLGPYNEQKPYKIDGTIKISKGNYYYLDSQFVFKPNGMETSRYAGLNIALERRLKPNEINYLDHPYLGMLIEVHPLK